MARIGTGHRGYVSIGLQNGEERFDLPEHFWGAFSAFMMF